MKKNSEFRADARTELKGQWGQPFLTTLMFVLIACIGAVTVGGKVSVVLYIVSGLLTILITIPMSYTYIQKFLDYVRGDKDEMASSLFDFFNEYKRAWMVSILQVVLIALWSILLIVPGIIKGMGYAMTNFIAKDNPELKPYECLEHSQEMMKGHKMELFKLYLSFIGWFILSIITLGIGLLWLLPYINTSVACFYENLRLDYEKQQMIK